MRASILTRAASSWRVVVRIALAAVIFVVLRLATTFLAAWLTGRIGMADRRSVTPI